MFERFFIKFLFRMQKYFNARMEQLYIHHMSLFILTSFYVVISIQYVSLNRNIQLVSLFRREKSDPTHIHFKPSGG